MKIVFLDRKSIGDDIDLSKFESFGEVVNYDFTYPKEVPKRASDADILIVNKTLIFCSRPIGRLFCSRPKGRQL